MEREVRSKEDIEFGRDITPTLTPLSFSLYNSHLHTHCSTCFSPLPQPNPNPNPNYPFFCSPTCSAALHLSSAERHLPPSPHSSDLRTALRLLRSHRSSPFSRLAGLLSNHHLLTCHSDDDNEVSERIRSGAIAMAEAIAKHRGVPYDDAVLEEATVALCVVLTNAVEVHDNEGAPALGIAVFGPTFSWINHSCSPNACYCFTLSSSSSPPPRSEEPKLRIAPFPRHSQQPLVKRYFPYLINCLLFLLFVEMRILLSRWMVEFVVAVVSLQKVFILVN